MTNPRIEFQRKILQFSVWQSCLNCKYWAPNAVNAGPNVPVRCMKFNIIPPYEVIVLSCQDWIERVPF